MPREEADAGEGQAARHQDRDTAVGSSTISQLPIVAATPAVGISRRGQPADTDFTCAQCREMKSSHYRCWSADSIAHLRRAVPQLPERIVAPAIRRAAGGDAAGLTSARSDGGEAFNAFDSEWRRASVDDRIGKLMPEVHSPTVSPSRIRQTAAGPVCCANRGEGKERNIDGN